jgi:small conductance mechanosensitive channel
MARRANLSVAGALAAGTAAAAILGADSIAGALLTFLLFYTAAMLAHVVGERLLSRSHVGPGAIELLLAVLHTTLIAIGLVEALATVGFNVTGLLAGLGIAGLAVGFAAQDTLANLIAGITILWDRPLRVGDWIQVGDSPPGRVRHLTLRTTRLETIDLGLLIIPNKDVTGARLFNFSMLEHARVRLSIGVAADADIHMARQVLVDVAAREPHVATNPPPVVNFTGITDTAVTLELVVTTTDVPRVRLLRAALLEHVVAALRARGIKPMQSSPPTDTGRGPWE